MNILKRKASTLRRNIITTLLSLGLLLSCDNPVTTVVVATVINAGVGGTGIVVGETGVVVGAITSFGSVYVNGVKFNVDKSSIELDGITGKSQSDLAIGMIVTVNGTTNPDGITGTATSIIYDDNIEGPILTVPTIDPNSDNTKKTFTILGNTIIVDSLTTRFENITFTSLDVNQVIEVSGYKTAANEITATYVKYIEIIMDGTSKTELKGNITNLMPTSFLLNGVIVNYTNSTEIKTNNGNTLDDLAEGIFIEVKGTYTADGSISVDKIEEKKTKLDDSDDDINLSGIITDYVNASNFLINGQSINTSKAKKLKPSNALSLLKNGVKVKIKGTVKNSILVASSIEVTLNEIRLSAVVSSVTNNTIVLTYPNGLGTISVITDESTQFHDDSIDPISSFKITDIDTQDFIEIEASIIANQIIASTLKRKEIDETLIQGHVESFINNTNNSADSSITILGISYIINDSTVFDNFATASDFFNKPLVLDDILRIKDDITADGIANWIK